MDSSKYLPPFTAAERGALAGAPDLPAEPVPGGEHEVTYADFLGDEVDE